MERHTCPLWWAQLHLRLERRLPTLRTSRTTVVCGPPVGNRWCRRHCRLKTGTAVPSMTLDSPRPHSAWELWDHPTAPAAWPVLQAPQEGHPSRGLQRPSHRWELETTFLAQLGVQGSPQGAWTLRPRRLGSGSWAPSSRLPPRWCLHVPCGLAGPRGRDGRSDHLASAPAQGKQGPDCPPGPLGAPGWPG